MLFPQFLIRFTTWAAAKRWLSDRGYSFDGWAWVRGNKLGANQLTLGQTGPCGIHICITR
jgi:hypothetical protein